jgi:hypothetical protein
MGGSGGSSGWSSSGSSEAMAAQRPQQASSSADSSAYNSEVNNLLQEALKTYNERDRETINKHLDVLKKAIEKEIQESVNLVFGGSIHKHTFLNGLSDVDVLVLVNNTSLEKSSPQEVLSYIAGQIGQRLPNTNVSVGNLAVTISYSDGCEIQLLPAIKTASGFRISDPLAEGKWSNVARPKAFAQKLTDVNQACSGRVVPVIKLFKAAVQEVFPKDLKISGYHAESLAIEAFKNYDGSKTYKDMLVHLCRTASDRVKAPIKDTTGQSLHVDDYLGNPNSQERTKVSHYLDRLAKRMEKSDKLRSKEEWEKLFE